VIARERFNTAYPALPESMWIDVPGVGAQGHWIPAEGVQLDRILGRIASLEFDMSEVMVIGPFRDVARQVPPPSPTSPRPGRRHRPHGPGQAGRHRRSRAR
jgi:hypothetical protein